MTRPALLCALCRVASRDPALSAAPGEARADLSAVPRLARALRAGRKTVKELADELQLDYGTLSPLLKRLAAAGFVERHRRREDERSVEITLTEEGQLLRTKAADIPQLIVDAYKLDADEFASLRNSLRELAESVTDNGPEARS